MAVDYNLKVTMNEYLPLRDVVFNTLRQAILKGELEPGERLMEIQLAERLGVSRTPIREAIRKLELEGLVLMIPRKENGRGVAGYPQRDAKALSDCTFSALFCNRTGKRGCSGDRKRHYAAGQGRTCGRDHRCAGRRLTGGSVGFQQ